MSSRYIFWTVVLLFFIFWTLRILFLPIGDNGTFIGVLNNTVLRIIFFFLPFLLASLFLYRETCKEAFAWKRSTLFGWVMADLYTLFLTVTEFINRTISLPTNLWLLLNFPIAPVIEELVFRGFIFTHLLKITGKVETILISSLLFTLIHFPGWIFISELKGENFLLITGQVFLFGFIQGVIRLYARSVLPNIVVHIVNNFFSLAAA